MNLLEDKTYQKFKVAFDKIHSKMNVQANVDECKMLHNSRISTQIKDNKGQFSPQMLIEASSVDLSTRSRMAFIAAMLKLNLSKQKTMLDTMEGYILQNYELEFRTVDERKKYIRELLKAYVRDYEYAQAGLDFIEFLIKDIDQSGYSMRNMVDCVKLLSETKGKVI